LANKNEDCDFVFYLITLVFVNHSNQKSRACVSRCY